ncbi:DNA alkylation repair enzyme [Candidatus Rhodobacter oscarellae]|uniref:DNA alkylation repair enzyme n=1 Tax=Candidatus Rhodobacter oscarellae TaxID=1675527 RepID=A0A0J9ECN5_9RHOB|nr:hypothetical protein [Candidatus Rhodobacter lobularis]KMW59484.1 DNA alkylation repair enzyme [Candidatus Rhodobacter lobularis]
MAEPLKNLFSADVIRAMGAVLARIDGFDRAAFEAQALSGLDDLEMMERSAQIAAALRAAMPLALPGALAPLTGLLHPDLQEGIDGGPPDAAGLRGWSLVPVGNYVAEDGLEHPEACLGFLAEMTKRFSAEFAVRPFFRDHPELTLETAAGWARDPNHHVRRLASEGSRPRLPWGIRLQDFVRDPAPVLPILAALKDDPSEYVRRSVANNLNDIAKDHPSVVTGIAARWMRDASGPRRRLVKHACRSLIKAGDPDTLAVFGYAAPGDLAADLNVSPAAITLGESLEVSLALTHKGAGPLPVLVDLVLGFRKANGQTAPKVFKWTETELPPGEPTQLTKSLPLKPVTTRRHYPGEQTVSVQVNGVIVAAREFELRVPDQDG